MSEGGESTCRRSAAGQGGARAPRPVLAGEPAPDEPGIQLAQIADSALPGVLQQGRGIGHVGTYGVRRQPALCRDVPLEAVKR